MTQKGQKQERMSCGEIFAVSGFHTQGYCIISPHQAAFYIMCYSLLTTNTSSCNLIGLPTFQHKSQKPIDGFLWLFLWHGCFALEIRFEMEIGITLLHNWVFLYSLDGWNGETYHSALYSLVKGGGGVNGCIQVVEWARACHVFPTDIPSVIHT